MRNLKNAIKAARAKGRVEAPAAGNQGLEKTPEELKKEIAENKEAMEALKEKEAEKPVKKELVSELEIHTTKPIIPSLMDCPFCGSEKSIKGMNRHIAAKHEVPGVTIQDLNDVEKGLKSLPDLVAEKFEGAATIANLSPEVEEKDFSDWYDIEEGPEDPEDLKDPGDKKIPDNPGPPGDHSCYENPGNPELKKKPGKESEYEFTCPDAPFPFNLLRRKKERKQ